MNSIVRRKSTGSKTLLYRILSAFDMTPTNVFVFRFFICMLNECAYNTINRIESNRTYIELTQCEEHSIRNLVHTGLPLTTAEGAAGGATRQCRKARHGNAGGRGAAGARFAF